MSTYAYVLSGAEDQLIWSIATILMGRYPNIKLHDAYSDAAVMYLQTRSKLATPDGVRVAGPMLSTGGPWFVRHTDEGIEFNIGAFDPPTTEAKGEIYKGPTDLPPFPNVVQFPTPHPPPKKPGKGVRRH
jgi:hypothetical protein